MVDRGGDPAFLYMPARSSTPNDNGDMEILFRNNELWQITAGQTTGHRTGLMWN